MRKYRQGGFDALLPKPRQDRGQPRRLSAVVTEALIALTEEHASWSVRQFSVVLCPRTWDRLRRGTVMTASDGSRSWYGSR
ncbi:MULTISPECIES: helix-turn-helix domain-containing protein [Ectothiorhodospira]|uniref:helix-turn-helix domain-containing protein n=1 Tax=Ectothiorhodospira TaxID=1051 RepID=UPI0004B8CFCD|nr:MULTISPECIES: helix-turn-helix domain-containing protein [Ectothiorhodospira]MCG5493327.1 helix-turn-helix domain-containing protein [Ectothiorhodospira variabilis]MCG5496674.1 helix-turn-helix domain-containing protein [Ectothiorhodospira variabilis]MCG5502656.1 helix-turn-helix domain-containing protein [Ectothiorhodospira variabilis]MCG5505578.1 helix-turn-helix domain-containing protein [Ectothiorhodospira variabilis]MCG5523383.1 helix-turn-helix domain-containing protein [Ectothiorhodo